MLTGFIIVVLPGANNASAPIVTAPFNNAAVVQQTSSASSLSTIILTVKFSLNSLRSCALIAYQSLSLIYVPSSKFLV